MLSRKGTQNLRIAYEKSLEQKRQQENELDVKIEEIVCDFMERNPGRILMTPDIEGATFQVADVSHGDNWNNCEVPGFYQHTFLDLPRAINPKKLPVQTVRLIQSCQRLGFKCWAVSRKDILREGDTAHLRVSWAHWKK